MTASNNPFTPTFERLPQQLAMFPLTGALLLPRQLLPLNIFEPRYLAMVDAALASQRMFGMIQPREQVEHDEAHDAPPSLCRVGCAGRITAFQETHDGRYLLELTGVCRFTVAAELAMENGYRRVRPQWQAFRQDLVEPLELTGGLDLIRVLLEHYAQTHGLGVQWDGLEKLGLTRAVDLLAMTLPFAAAEKQALLEAVDARSRLDVLSAALAMDSVPGTSSGNPGTAPRALH